MARQFILKSDTSVTPVKLTIDYAGQLNEQQYAAATAPDGPVLIVAGAGTGKTRTLIYRVAYLVETGTLPEEIVLLTFTRRASEEMLARASVLLDGRCSLVRGGTFHSFFVNVLREYAPAIGYPANFNILDASDSADILDVLRTERGYHKSEQRFPRKRTIQSVISSAENLNLDLAEILEERFPQFLKFSRELETLWTDYRAYKRERGLIDYDDILSLSCELLRRNESIRHQVGRCCRHVLVDEYQDTNVVQAELVKQITSVHGNVTAVGDDAQSIYRFRGADYRNLFFFPDQFPGARVFILEQNYRSTQPILTLSNHVMSRATRKYDKHLFSHKSEGAVPAVIPAPDTRYESRFVAQMILNLREEGVPLNRIAVLFRSGFNSYDLELELNRHDIPFVKYGGIRLSEASHIKDVVSYWRVAENPNDTVAWNRLLQLLEGIGPRTARDLMEWVTQSEYDGTFQRPLANRYAQTLRSLLETIAAIREESLPLTAQYDRILAHYEPILKTKYFEDYPKRFLDLEHFGTMIGNTNNRRDLLASLALDPLDFTVVSMDTVKDNEPPVILSTIHSAKGLEFHSVFIIQALDGVLPSTYTLDDPESLEEELRLLYVAVTRAEENLFISYPVLHYRRGKGQHFTLPSRFISGIPEQLLETWTLVDEEKAETKPAPFPALNERSASDAAILPF